MNLSIRHFLTKERFTRRHRYIDNIEKDDVESM